VDAITTWLFIVALFLCGANLGALLHARFGLPRGAPFWPGVLISLPLAVMAAAQLGAVPTGAKIVIALLVILSSFGALLAYWRFGSTAGRSGMRS
jgi:hypothetical protein